MSNAQTPGRRLFIAGCVVLLLLGTVHLLAVYQGNFGTPQGDREIELDRAARATTYDIGPIQTTSWHLIQLLNASYSALIFFAVALNFAMLPAAIAHGRFRVLTVINVLFAGILTLLTVIYKFPPPMVFGLTAAALFVASLVKQRSP